MFFLPPSTKLGQGNIFTPVCHSVHGGGGMCGCSWGCAWLLLGGHAWLLLGGHAWLLWGGACMVAPGGHAWLLWGACVVALGGHVWLLWGACMVALVGGAWLLWGGVHGCSGGGCMVALGGCAWLLRGGHVWLFQGGMCGIRRDTEIRSMSRRYASYWNAFLFKYSFTTTNYFTFSIYKFPPPSQSMLARGHIISHLCQQHQCLDTQTKCKINDKLG